MSNAKVMFNRTLYQRAYNRHLRQKAIALLGGKCVRCGFSDVRALQIDHKHGGGSREHDRLGCYAVYQRIAIHNITEPYQLLCANCNFIKRYEENEVPKTIQPESELNIKIKSYRKIKKGKYVYAPKELFAGNKTLAPLSFLYEQTTDHKLDKYISDEVNPAFS